MIFICSNMSIKIELGFGNIERVFQNAVSIVKQHIINNAFTQSNFFETVHFDAL